MSRRKSKRPGGSLKIRFADFRRTTIECVDADIDYDICRKLLETGFRRGNKPVRLASEEEVNQLGLFGAETTVLSDMPDHEDED